MKRIILFRYHHQFERNLELLKFYQYLNPSIKIYGLYGGDPANYPESSKMLSEVLEHNFLLQHPNFEWNWKNSDMSYKIWYQEFGHELDFDIMHSIEWDLLLFDSLDNLYRHGGMNELILSGLTSIDKVKKQWYWVRNEQKMAEYHQLIDYVKKEFGYLDTPFACIGPGTAIPRLFLEEIMNIDLPDLCNDEVRIPLFAQILGLKMKDSGFFREWFSKREFRYFNANGFLIDVNDIKLQLQKYDGRRAFHPCNQDFGYNDLVDLYQAIV